MSSANAILTKQVQFRGAQGSQLNPTVADFQGHSSEELRLEFAEIGLDFPGADSAIGPGVEVLAFVVRALLKKGELHRDIHVFRTDGHRDAVLNAGGE